METFLDCHQAAHSRDTALEVLFLNMLLTVSLGDMICVTSCLRQADATCVPAAPRQSSPQYILVCVGAFSVDLSEQLVE